MKKTRKTKQYCFKFVSEERAMKLLAMRQLGLLSETLPLCEMAFLYNPYSYQVQVNFMKKANQVLNSGRLDEPQNETPSA